MTAKVLQINKSELEDIFRKVVRSYYHLDRMKIIPTKEAMKRLNLGRTAFYELEKNPKTLLRKSKKGGYLESSVEAEIVRLTSDEPTPIYINTLKPRKRNTVK